MSNMSDNKSDDDFHDASDKPTSSHNVSQEQNKAKDEKDTDDECFYDYDDNDEDEEELEKKDPKIKIEKPLDIELTNEELENLEKDLTPEQLEANKEKAEKLKLDGNQLFKDGKAVEAVKVYTEALNVLPLSCTKERAILFANRAAAKIQLEAKKSALEDCDKSLNLWPGYMRCLIRRAKLNEGEENYDEALADYKAIYELDPSNFEARAALVRLPPLAEEKREKLKQEVFGKLKDLGNMILKPFGLSTDNFQMAKDPNSGSYSINMKN